MKLTLLDMTQRILSNMDSDEVNSIDDTYESEQVATIIRDVYMDIVTNRNWRHHRRLLSILPSGTTALPTHMSIREDFKEMAFVNYNKVKTGETRQRYEPIKYLEPDDFLRVTNGCNSDDENIDTIQDPSGVQLFIRNNRAPSYYTSFDDQTIIFDSYDKEVDSTLQESKVQAMAYIMPDWVHEDDAIPDLPTEGFSALLAEAQSRAMFWLKQMEDVKSEQESRRQQRWLSRKQWTVNGGIKYPNYGRRGRRYLSPPLDDSSYIDRYPNGSS